jgi:hypothetical protein
VSGWPAGSLAGDGLGKGVEVEVGVGTAVLAESGASVGVSVGRPCLAQAHSKKRPPPITTAYETNLDNRATPTEQSTL